MGKLTKKEKGFLRLLKNARKYGSRRLTPEQSRKFDCGPIGHGRSVFEFADPDNLMSRKIGWG